MSTKKTGGLYDIDKESDVSDAPIWQDIASSDEKCEVLLKRITHIDEEMAKMLDSRKKELHQFDFVTQSHFITMMDQQKEMEKMRDNIERAETLVDHIEDDIAEKFMMFTIKQNNEAATLINVCHMFNNLKGIVDTVVKDIKDLEMDMMTSKISLSTQQDKIDTLEHFTGLTKYVEHTRQFSSEPAYGPYGIITPTATPVVHKQSKKKSNWFKWKAEQLSMLQALGPPPDL
jgi:hypothetical protein